jgi:hypothetical protein
VNRAQRVDPPPHRAEQQRQRNHPHPKQHVDRIGQRIGPVIGEYQRRGHDISRGDQPEPTQQPPERGAVHDPLDGFRHRPPGRACPQPRSAPQHPQAEERGKQGENRALHQQIQRQWQILPPSDAMREEHPLRPLSWVVDRRCALFPLTPPAVRAQVRTSNSATS